MLGQPSLKVSLRKSWTVEENLLFLGSSTPSSPLFCPGSGYTPPPKTPLNFTQILEEVWWKLDLALDHDATQASFEAGLIDSLKAGTTTVIDHHCSPSFIEGSLSLLGDTGKKLGIATGLAFEVTDRNGQELFERSLHENLDAAEKHSQDQELAACWASMPLSPSVRNL